MQEAHAAGIKVGLGSSSQNARECGRETWLAANTLMCMADGNTVRNITNLRRTFFCGWQNNSRSLPSEAIVFEDSVAGMQAAIAGGFWRVGLGGKHGAGAHVALNRLLIGS